MEGDIHTLAGPSPGVSLEWAVGSDSYRTRGLHGHKSRWFWDRANVCPHPKRGKWRPL